jgi:hypothetical protein
MPVLYIPLEKDLRARLDALARENRRRPQEQAAWLLARALRRVRTPGAPAVSTNRLDEPRGE